MSRRRVLLCAPPWRTPYDASLAVATLRPILEHAGIACDELHGALHFPPTPTPLTFIEQFSAAIFAPCVYPEIDRERLAAKLVARYIDECEYGGLITWADTLDRPALLRSVVQDMARADLCVASCVEAACAADVDIVGFSATFEGQLPGALAIARGIKARRPEIKVMLGGAACFEGQGLGVAASFPGVLDAVCHAEGEDTIVPLVEALRGERPLAEVPGIAWTAPDGQLQHTEPTALRYDLDALPIPVYDGWVEAYRKSSWAPLYPPKLFFESSRGCWWGQKHLCTFCGLNSIGLPFRAKTARRVVDEIQHLWRTYPQVEFLQATDNILDMDYLKTVLPQLEPLARTPVRPLQMFFEIKSNLRKDQVRVLAAGGIVEVQPGIESLSDEVLGLMSKGATGFGQVQLIKWAAEHSIGLVYNLLIKSPGEQPAWYDRMSELIPWLEQLPPPTGVAIVRLERFSPYHQHPEKYGMTGVRPAHYYRDIYPDPRVDLDRIAYNFDFDHPQADDADLRAAHKRFVEAVAWWQQRYQPGRAYYLNRNDAVLVTDRRDPMVRTHVVTGTAATLVRELDRVRPRHALGKSRPDLDEAMVDAAIDTWRHRRWVAANGDKLLCVLPDGAARKFDGPQVAPAPDQRPELTPPEPAVRVGRGS